MEQKVSVKAQKYWNLEQPLEAGRLIYEHLPKEGRPIWAAKILQKVLYLVPKTMEIEAIFEIVNDPSRWCEAHDVFMTIRSVTLRTQDPLYLNILELAEIVAKVTYNSGECPAPFDHNSGWKLAKTLKSIIRQIDDPLFTDKMWLIFFEENKN